MVVFNRVCAAGSKGPTEGGARLSDDNSELEPPDPIPNSAVKRFSADGSVGFPHVRVGHRQAYFEHPAQASRVFFFVRKKSFWARKVGKNNRTQQVFSGRRF